MISDMVKSFIERHFGGKRGVVRIRGLRLPAALEDAVYRGEWMRAAPGPKLSGYSWPGWAWCFYSFEQMDRETNTVVGLGNLEYPGIDAFEFDHVLCIADSGHDWPICLVYSDPDVPGPVVAFDRYAGAWEELARTFDEFASMLVLLPLVKDEADANSRLPPGTIYITETGKRSYVSDSQ